MSDENGNSKIQDMSEKLTLTHFSVILHSKFIVISSGGVQTRNAMKPRLLRLHSLDIKFSMG